MADIWNAISRIHQKEDRQHQAIPFMHQNVHVYVFDCRKFNPAVDTGVSVWVGDMLLYIS